MSMKAEKFQLNNSYKEVRDLQAIEKSISQDIQSLNGINAVRLDPIANTVTVDYNEGQVSSSEIQQKLKEGNYL